MKLILTALLILPVTSLAVAAPTQKSGAEVVGSPSANEPALLIQESVKAMSAEKWDDAIRSMKRLLARYPTHPESTQTKFDLARTYLKIQQARQAVPLLKDATETWGDSLRGLQSRILLGRAYLAFHDRSAAILAAKDSIQLSDRLKTPHFEWNRAFF